MCSLYVLVRIDPHFIAMFKFLLEGYDNIAYFTVLERHSAILKISFSPSHEQRLRHILREINDSVSFTVSEWI